MASAQMDRYGDRYDKYVAGSIPSEDKLFAQNNQVFP